MGKKKGSNSWLTLVKRAFRSPTKDHDNKTKTSKRREEHEQEEDEKKREKRRWLFRKPSNQEPVAVVNQPQQAHSTVQAQTPPSPTPQTQTPPNHVAAAAAAAAERRQAIAVAVATAAAAEAAVATAQAAAEVVRLTRPTNFFREHYAALVIQTAFRGYLARRAHRALKGLVKLQALVRGHNVRKQAKMTLQCMQALVRVQNRVRDRRMRLSQDGSRTSAMNSDTNSLLERISISRDGSSVGGDWDDRPHTLEEIQAMLTTRKEAALKREKALSYAFTHQIWRSGRNTSSEDEEEQLQLEERHQWMDRWMPTKPWEGRPRGSTDQRDHNPIKTVEIDTVKPYAYSSTPTMRRPYQQQQQQPPISYSTIGSPLHKGAQHHRLSLHHSPATPSPSKTRPIQVRSASPRYVRDEDRNNYRTAAHTPRVVGSHYYNEDECTTTIPIPSYMAATESAKARIRSQSAPRNRPSTPEREGIGSAKKRLSFPVPADPYCISDSSVGDGSGDVVLGRYVKSPGRFKRGKGGGYIGMEQQSNLSSCYTDGELSPSYANDMRRWLR